MFTELTIIIPSLNEENYIGKTLESIANQHFQGSMEVIVVDGYSSDKTAEVVKSYIPRIPNLRIIQTEKGISHQRNKGVEESKYEYLFFIDADMRLPDNFIQKILKKHHTSENFIATTLHFPYDANIADYFVAALAYILIPITNIFFPICPGTFTFTTKSHHNSINGYDEEAIIGEDIDYTIRSLKKGVKYNFYYWPPIFSSPRRARKMGRFNLLIMWIRWYIYNVKNGPIKNEDVFEYPLGKH
ncbi:MAG TPA: glycosyltransferase [Candidatus Nitrosocosmicus sp.]|nr:glycosyltransferase [Candidatus Nitrosocosmicus sp.]